MKIYYNYLIKVDTVTHCAKSKIMENVSENYFKIRIAITEELFHVCQCHYMKKLLYLVLVTS